MIIIIIIHNHLITTITFMIEFNPRDIPIISYYIPFIPSNHILVPWDKIGHWLRGGAQPSSIAKLAQLIRGEINCYR